MKKLQAIISPFFILAFTASSALVPFSSFAKEDNPGKAKGPEIKQEKQVQKDDKKEEKSTLSCWRAFGHLVAPGWILLNGTSTASSYCLLPFGISMKFHSASSTPDTIAPVISAITSDVRLTDAVIHWKTNEKADSAAFWSTSSPVVMSSSTAQVHSDGRVKDHTLHINGLSASTTYHVILRSHDVAGNSTTSAEFVITTLAPIVVGDTTPPVIESIVAVVSTSSASIGWMTNEPATSKVFYGTTTPINISATTTAFVESTALTTNHLVSITGLQASTTYNFVVQSKDLAGNIRSATEFSVLTHM